MGVGVCAWGGGEATPKCPYIRRLGPFFGVPNFEFKYVFFFQKNEYFLGFEDFVEMFAGHHKIGLVLGVISIYFRVFS